LARYLLVCVLSELRTTLLPPQQQNGAAAALSQLGALAGLAGGAAAVKSPADQYISLMQSVTVSDRIIDQFKLMDVFEAQYRQDARLQLAARVQISAGKKDGLITVDVDDNDRDRAAAIANAYAEALRHVTSTLAVSEAQQRRAFFEAQLQQTKDKLTRAQIALQGSGINQGTLKTEPRAAAEGYARLRAELTSAEVQLQTMQRMLSENSPELLQQQALLAALRGEIRRLEQQDAPNSKSDEYITRYREFKYQETLFELFARQYEAARLDESREGALIQILDVATPPERKSKPKRATIAIATTLIAVIILVAALLVRHLFTIESPRRSVA
jgi:capsule polysaccharide export protein KpsE/RkpR